ncbi:FtsX-like permease family protein [Actinophytocola oryzae]|uniref:FtsX-like permease family protein n=2 Tax=Actinophytocola oryzae TaxID=502181 RepID=A0A4R7W490_9PSEU|nr:FtsX-like permease family protein [Actinophytocola oryzae]
MGDLALGVRLAVGGGRTSLVRFALGAVGIAIATFVLLVAASVNRMTAEADARQAADLANTEEIAGVDPVYYTRGQTNFRDEPIDIAYVHATGEHPPVPAGLRDLPRPGEMLVSPALAELLDGPEGALLRPRFPDRVTGVLGQDLVPTPDDLTTWVGADATLAEDTDALKVYRFGGSTDPRSLDPGLMALALLGGVAVLLPVFVFVSAVSRIAGAERDRRLSALRLVGSGAHQVRRIAAAESLVGTAAGLVLGTALFAVARLFAEHVELFGIRSYPSDVVPDPLAAAVIALAVPAVSVLTALVALRGTIIEPLGVVRQARPVRRRLWWRLAIVAAGIALLATRAGADRNSFVWAWAVASGATLLLVGVPVLLPWLVERVAGRIEGGPPSWQLAVRRLRLDSGTSARVVSGVTVILAGAIAVQTVLMTVQGNTDPAAARAAEANPHLEVSTNAADADNVLSELSTVDAVKAAHKVRNVSAYAVDDTAYYDLQVLDCPAMRAVIGVHHCTDGEVYQSGEQDTTPMTPGETVEFRDYPTGSSNYTVTSTWTTPTELNTIDTPLPDGLVRGSIIVTPGALANTTLPDTTVTIYANLDGTGTADDTERVRNALAGFRWRTQVWAYEFDPVPPHEEEMFQSIRAAMYAGAVFTLLLAGVSLLVLALEHIRERRRQLAILVATGVQRGVLVRSLLWQITLPIALGVVIAVATGVSLAWLIMRLTNQPVDIDWPGIALLSGGATALSLLITTMTLPFLRGATRLTSLRTE